MANLMPGRDREASVTTVDVPLTPETLRAYFLGREAYRRTNFIIATRGEQTAVLKVVKASDEPLFSPIVAVEILGAPDECAIVRAPEVDTANPTQMVRSALHLAPGARCVVVQGRYEHMSFILEPRPLQIRVVDVVPPEPPKLVDQVQRVLDVAEALPPIEPVPELVDLRELLGRHPSDRYLLPCRVSGVAPPGGRVDYLDQRPAQRQWTLVGCARSREIYRWFYDEEPTYVEMCPRRLLGDILSGYPELRSTRGSLPVLTKCCLLESRVEQEGHVVTVPWGATLDEVHRGLGRLANHVMGTPLEPTWSVA